MEVLVALIDACDVAHLATCDAAGPASTPVFYAPFGPPGGLVWCSAPDVLHSLQVALQPELAVSIARPDVSAHWVRGIQMRGTASTPDAMQAAYRKAYLARFPSVEEVLREHPSLRFYAFKPRWARYVRTDWGVRRNQEWPLPG